MLKKKGSGLLAPGRQPGGRQFCKSWDLLGPWTQDTAIEDKKGSRRVKRNKINDVNDDDDNILQYTHIYTHLHTKFSIVKMQATIFLDFLKNKKLFYPVK